MAFMSKARLATLGCVLVFAPATQATVFIKEVFINPPLSLDMVGEFVELLGTPGMKLDGYAIVVLNGTEERFYPLGSITTVPEPHPEIDEFFSLDGLTLGPNGILVVGIADPVGSGWYPSLLPDSNFARWSGIPGLWNGGLDDPGQLEDDGSVTIMLIRNRPGDTEASQGIPPDLRWGKDVAHDAELFSPVLDPLDGQDEL